MLAWPERAVEEANLFNPAFCATLLARAAGQFTQKAGQSLPFSLAFLILPVVLHRATRMALPNTTLTSLLPWVQENRQHLVDFGLRVNRLRGITREAMMFGISNATLGLDAQGNLIVGDKHRSATEKRTSLFTDEARDCVDRAGFVGRWFAAAGTTATVYSAWGIRP